MDKVIMFFAVLYGISVVIFTLYFNWIYANEHGFWSWLIFGEVIATFKGFAWPFFIDW